MKVINLTKGFQALVDDTDFEWLSKWKWSASRQGNKVYAKRGTSENKFFYMHREILELKPGEFGDHKDRDTLNNQRDNLRKCTRAGNNRNKSKKKNGQMKYIGVSKNHNRFMATVTHEYKRIYVGTFDTQEEAAIAYNKKKTELHGEFSNLNVL